MVESEPQAVELKGTHRGKLLQVVTLKPYVMKGSLSYLSSPCFSKNVLQSGVGIVH